MKFSRLPNIYILLVIFLLFYSACDNKITAPDKVVNQPTGLEAYAYNNSITIEFYGYNVEEGFEGYNVFITTSSSIDPDSVSPVKNNYNSIPTLLNGVSGCYPYATQKSFVTLKKDSQNKSLQNNRTYYIAVNAYSMIGNKEFISPLSEIIPVYVANQKDVILFNNSISGKTNDALIFRNNGRVSVTNAPDTLNEGWKGDLAFRISQINGKYYPMLSILSNNNSIQDLGYYQNVDQPISIPSHGYIKNDEVVARQNHVYILYKPSLTVKYIKLFITEIDDTYSSLTSEAELKIQYIY